MTRRIHPAGTGESLKKLEGALGKLQALRRMCEASGQPFYAEIIDEIIAALPIGTGERLKRLEDALTPSAETKAAYIGEFTVPWPIVGEDGNDYIIRINVPWTTIKEIMGAIRLHALPDCGRPVPITRAGAVPVVRPES